MVSRCDSETGPEVVHDGPRSGLPLQRGPEGGDAASEGHTNDEDDLDTLLAIVACWRNVVGLTLSQLTC